MSLVPEVNDPKNVDGDNADGVDYFPGLQCLEPNPDGDADIRGFQFCHPSSAAVNTEFPEHRHVKFPLHTNWEFPTWGSCDLVSQNRITR